MLLNTWYRLLGAQIGGTSDNVKFKDCNGTERILYKLTNSSYYVSAFQTLNFDGLSFVRTASGNNSIGVVFGDGSDPVSADDYCLSGNIIGGIASSASISRVHCAEYAEFTAIYTITNGGSAEITISEIGYYGMLPYSSTAFMSTLVERTVLDSPVTIPAGGVGQITYTIRMNYPTA